MDPNQIQRIVEEAKRMAADGFFVDARAELESAAQSRLEHVSRTTQSSLFGLEGTDVAIAGSIAQAFLQHTPTAVQDAIEANPRIANAISDQISYIDSSPDFQSAINDVDATLASMAPDTLAAAKYLAARDLQSELAEILDQSAIQSAAARLQEDHLGALRQATELALDPQIRDLVTGVDQAEIVEDAVDLFGRVEATTEAAVTVIEEADALGVESKELLTPEIMHKLAGLIVFFFIAVNAASTIPEAQPYIEPLSKALTELALIYQMMSERRRYEREMREED